MWVESPDRDIKPNLIVSFPRAAMSNGNGSMVVRLFDQLG
jgi:hypothetical protein